MNVSSVTITYKQLGAIVLVLINILLIGPGGWTLKNLWNHAEQFKEETKDKIDDLQNQVNNIQVDLPDKYITKQAFIEYRTQMYETIKYLDSKLQSDTRSHERKNN